MAIRKCAPKVICPPNKVKLLSCMLLISASFIVMIHIAHAAPYTIPNTTPSITVNIPAFYSITYGVLLGKNYSVTSPATDIRNLMGTTWNLRAGNMFAEKYLFTQPLPYTGDVVKQVKAKAAEHGLAALFGNGFEENGLIQIQLDTLGPNSDNKYTINLDESKLINFSVGKTDSLVSHDDHVSASDTMVSISDKILVTAVTIKKVLDHLVNMKGVDQASTIAKRHGQIVLLGETDEPKATNKMHSPRKKVPQLDSTS